MLAKILRRILTCDHITASEDELRTKVISIHPQLALWSTSLRVWTPTSNLV
jgi:hypothetical protein